MPIIMLLLLLLILVKERLKVEPPKEPLVLILGLNQVQECLLTQVSQLNVSSPSRSYSVPLHVRVVMTEIGTHVVLRQMVAEVLLRRQNLGQVITLTPGVFNIAGLLIEDETNKFASLHSLIFRTIISFLRQVSLVNHLHIVAALPGPIV